jgi:Domain of unknown function (DUF4377)
MIKARAITISLLSIVFVVSCDRVNDREAILFVSPQTALCGTGGLFDSTETCLQISESSSGPYFLNKINGFNHESGFRYKLRVQASSINSDSVNQGLMLKLLETLEKTPVN